MDLEVLLVESGIQLASMARQAAQMDHPTLVGRTRENLFQKTLSENLLPARYNIGNGRVVGPDGRMSREADVVFYDGLDCPRFAPPAGDTIYPSAGVYGIAEIKSTLDKAALEDSVQKISSFKGLYNDEPWYRFAERYFCRALAEPKPFGIIFAYTAATSLNSLLSNLANLDAELEPSLRCDLVVVNGMGILARSLDGHTAIRGMPTPGQNVPPIALETQYKTLFLFYQLLSEMLISVPTFPVSPALYQRVAREIQGRIVSGQIREIDAETGRKTSLSNQLLERVVRLTAEVPPTRLADIERAAFGEGGAEFTSLGDGEAWIYDPERLLQTLLFEPRAVLGGDPVRSLASDCLLVTVEDRLVLLPRVYLVGENVSVEERF